MNASRGNDDDGGYGCVIDQHTLVLVLSEFTYAVDAEVVHNFLIIFGLSYLTLRPVNGEGPITARSKRTIIPSSRLLDSNNSATPQLTSHKQALNPTTPLTYLHNAKRNADDADWSSSLLNEEQDLGDSDGTKEIVYRAKHLRCTHSSASDLGTHTGSKYMNHSTFIGTILMQYYTNLYRHLP